jgi:hypothetical protein
MSYRLYGGYAITRSKGGRTRSFAVAAFCRGAPKASGVIVPWTLGEEGEWLKFQ